MKETNQKYEKWSELLENNCRREEWLEYCKSNSAVLSEFFAFAKNKNADEQRILEVAIIVLNDFCTKKATEAWELRDHIMSVMRELMSILERGIDGVR